MVEIRSHTALASRDSRRFRERFTEVAIATILLVVVAALWFALFSFVPLELAPPRIR